MKWSEIYLKLKCHHRLCKTRQQMGQSQISTQLAEVSHRLSIGSQEMAAWEAWRSPAFKSALAPRTLSRSSAPGARTRTRTHRAFALAPPPPAGLRAFLLRPQQDLQPGEDTTVPGPGGMETGAVSPGNTWPRHKVLHCCRLPLKAQKLREFK